MTANPSKIADQIQSLTVLVVDDNQYMRKMIRNLLVNCGIKDIYEANDGIAALDAIRSIAPDVVILDWEMPLLSGAELVRIVRSPGVFPMPDVPIIMLSGHGERWRVVEAARRPRISDQAGFGEGAVRPPGLHHDAAAAGGAARRLLRPGAAQADVRKSRRCAHHRDPVGCDGRLIAADAKPSPHNRFQSS